MRGGAGSLLALGSPSCDKGKQRVMKSINVYDREKRHQIMNDVGVLLGALVDEERHGYK